MKLRFHFILFNCDVREEFLLIYRQPDKKFELVSEYKPTGDQPQAINQLTKGIEDGEKAQILLGATGTGKTFTISNVIANVNKPTLILSHNKTLAGQLYGEMKNSSLIMRLNILFPTMTTTNRKHMFHQAILILKKMRQLMMRLISCGTLPPLPCWNEMM